MVRDFQCQVPRYRGRHWEYQVLQSVEVDSVDDRLVNATSPAALGLDCQLEYVYSIGRKPNKS